ncbi:hypothetical protein [Ralstonia pseudosolanacearum]
MATTDGNRMRRGLCNTLGPAARHSVMPRPSPAEPSPVTQTRADHIGAYFRRGRVGFRRDLRHIDRAALHYALRHCREVRCAFLFEREYRSAAGA